MNNSAGMAKGERGIEPIIYSPLWPYKLLRIRLNSGIAVISDIGREMRCSKCKEYWPADTQFYHPLPSKEPGLQPWCKACYGTWDRERRELKRQKKEATMKIRRLLKAAQTQLDMPQEIYVSTLIHLTGKASSTELGYDECKQVLKHFETLGYQPPVNPREKQIKRIQYLWIRLSEEKKLNKPGTKAMYSFCHKFTGSTSIYKAQQSQLSACIEALKNWCKREKVAFNE